MQMLQQRYLQFQGVTRWSCRAVEAHVALEQALQCARDYFRAHSPNGSCLAEADLHETMLAFAKQALNSNDPEVAIRVLDMQRQTTQAAASKRSWVAAFLVASAAVATGCATPMAAIGSNTRVEASFSNIQIIIICILLVVLVRGARR